MDDRSKTWPTASSAARYSALPFHRRHTTHRPRYPHNFKKHTPYPNPSSRPSSPLMSRPANFADIPFDILAKIAAPFDIPDLWSASTVCRSWREALGPLREAMVLLRWGKRFKHGYGGGAVKPDRGKALESFLKGVERGSAAAMVDAGLMYWEMGMKEEGMALYRRAAEMGYPAGQCNLGICYLEADPQEPLKAVQLFYEAAKSGYARAQYNLARCLRKGHGVNCNISEAARWFLRAAEGGNSHAMHNVSKCYSAGEGFTRNMQRAKIWLKRAADHGDKKAQYDHGLELFSSGDHSWRALYYLELATRAGVTEASHIRDVLLPIVSATSRDRAMEAANKWQPTRSHHYR